MLHVPSFVTNNGSNFYFHHLCGASTTVSQSALTHADFVTAEINDGGCVVSCNECLHVCNPLLVVTNASGKMRLVMDL